MVLLQLRITEKKNILPTQHCVRRNHPHIIGENLILNALSFTSLVMLIIYKEKVLQQPNDAHISDKQEEEQLFLATCFAVINSSESWLIESGCTNYMIGDENLFRELDRSIKSRIRIRNVEYLLEKGKGVTNVQNLYIKFYLFLKLIRAYIKCWATPRKWT